MPKALSFLVYNEPQGEIKGIKELQQAAVRQYGPGYYIPDVQNMFWSFRIMIAAGVILTGGLASGWLLIEKNSGRRKYSLNYL